MSQPGQNSPLAVVFLLHIAMEIPIAVQGLWSPRSLPFLELNNTSLVMLKLYAALSLGSCIAAFLCFSLPEFLPGKRALAIGLTVYHSVCSTILFQSPRFVPYSLGALAETYKIIPENIWGCAHGFLSLGLVFWWQATVAQAAAVRKIQ